MRLADIKLFVDSADLNEVRKFEKEPWVSGYTTNPTLMRKAGVTDYMAFVSNYLAVIGSITPVSFEVIADDLNNMERQAMALAGIGHNVYVKIPVTTTNGTSTLPVVRSLSSKGVKVNVTAVFTRKQIRDLVDGLTYGTPSIISIFAGRIADTGRVPTQDVAYAHSLANPHRAAIPTNIEILWASPRQVLDIRVAELAGADIITVTPDLLAKTKFFDRDLEEFSRETVTMFYTDAKAAGYSL